MIIALDVVRIIMENKVKEGENNPFQEFKDMVVANFEKYGKVDEDGNLIIDSGFQKMKIGSLKKRPIKQYISDFLNKKDLAKRIWRIIPYFYDKSKLWWLWNEEEKKCMLFHHGPPRLYG